MTENRFYVCENCENVVGMIHDAGVPLYCCHKEMKHLKPGESDGSAQKHTPVVSVNGKTVKVDIGSDSHPMTADHKILWVYLQTDKGGQRKRLEQDGDPVVTFALADEKPIAAYAFCNLHGLWKTEVK